MINKLKLSFFSYFDFIFLPFLSYLASHLASRIALASFLLYLSPLFLIGYSSLSYGLSSSLSSDYYSYDEYDYWDQISELSINAKDPLPSQFPRYYTIDDSNYIIQDNLRSSSKDFFTLERYKMILFTFEEVALSLLHWIEHDETFGPATEAYDRIKHFGRWTRDRYDDNCYNTRAKILIRDSLQPVTFKATNHCLIQSGYWRDPYTNRIITEAKEIQIDHVVPLKNAYLTGAWQWRPKERCLYANFLGNNFHLLAVLGVENSSKGDRSPDRYLPKNQQAVCPYLEKWLKIKLIWGLVLAEPEAKGIQYLINYYHCNVNDLIISKSDLEKQRSLMNQTPNSCSHFGN